MFVNMPHHKTNEVDENGKVTSKQYILPKVYEFELDNILLSIMPYGIAADLLKMDMISGYGKYFYERYMELKQQIDTRVTTGIIQVEGGVDF